MSATDLREAVESLIAFVAKRQGRRMLDWERHQLIELDGAVAIASQRACVPVQVHHARHPALNVRSREYFPSATQIPVITDENVSDPSTETKYFLVFDGDWADSLRALVAKAEAVAAAEVQPGAADKAAVAEGVADAEDDRNRHPPHPRAAEHRARSADEAVRLNDGDEWATVGRLAKITGKTSSAIRSAFKRARDRRELLPAHREAIQDAPPGGPRNRYRIRGVWRFLFLSADNHERSTKNPES